MSKNDIVKNKFKNDWDISDIPKCIELIKYYVSEIEEVDDGIIKIYNIVSFLPRQKELFEQVLKNPQYIPEYNSLRDFYFDMVENETSLYKMILHFVYAPFYTSQPDSDYKIHSDKDNIKLSFITMDIITPTNFSHDNCPFQPYLNENYHIFYITSYNVDYIKDPRYELRYVRDKFGKIRNIRKKFFIVSAYTIKKIDEFCDLHGYDIVNNIFYTTIF